MKIYIKQIATNKLLDISGIVTNFQWSGTLENAVRSFSFSVINSPFDEEMKAPVPTFHIGDYISLYTENDDAFPNYLLFYGKIAHTNRTSQKGSVSFVCYDMLYNLSKSVAFRSFTGTPESIAAQIATEHGLPIQFIKPTGINIGTVVYEDKTYIEIINEAYKKASESTGIDYYVYMDGSGFCVDEEGHTKTFVQLNDKTNIFNSVFEESAENIVNYVEVFDENDKKVHIEQDAKSIEKYGKFSKSYHVEKYVDMVTGAKKQLHGVDTTLSFESIGEITWWSGRMVQVYDDALEITGNYIITSDTHKWEGGKYTCALELKFYNLISQSVVPTYTP